MNLTENKLNNKWFILNGAAHQILQMKIDVNHDNQYAIWIRGKDTYWVSADNVEIWHNEEECKFRIESINRKKLWEQLNAVFVAKQCEWNY